MHGRGRATWQLEAQIEVRAGFRPIWFLGEGHWDLVQGIRCRTFSRLRHRRRDRPEPLLTWPSPCEW